MWMGNLELLISFRGEMGFAHGFRVLLFDPFSFKFQIFELVYSESYGVELFIFH